LQLASGQHFSAPLATSTPTTPTEKPQTHDTPKKLCQQTQLGATRHSHPDLKREAPVNVGGGVGVGSFNARVRNDAISVLVIESSPQYRNGLSLQLPIFAAQAGCGVRAELGGPTLLDVNGPLLVGFGGGGFGCG